MQTTSVRCRHCQRAICQHCDHRVKGAPYCQECIVTGIETLRAKPYQSTAAPLPNRKSPWVATLFALVPGLGAAYNGQPVKALCHFVWPVSVWQLASLIDGFPAFGLALGGGALYLFSLYDAWQTAQHAAAGADLAAADARVKHWLQSNVFVWGLYLLGIGALTALDQLAPRVVSRAWPLLLLLAVWYGWRNVVKSEPAMAPPETTYRPRPVSFMTTGLSAPPDHHPNAPPANLINAQHRFDR
jgi:hypothetical protein